jgi:teichuronic acid exporter
MVVVLGEPRPSILFMTVPELVSSTQARSARDKALMRGLAWTGAVKWIAQALSWISTLVVAHLLSPDDYGIASATMLFVTLVQLVNEFGLGAAVISKRNLSEVQLGKLATFSLALGAVFCVVANAGANAVAGFYHKPEVAAVVRLVSITFVTSGIVVVPRALLTRELRYATLAAIDAAESVITIVVTLTLATLHWGYWSLACGTVAGRLVALVGTLRARRTGLGSPREFSIIADPLRVGWHVVLGGLGWYIFRTADSNLITRRLGTEAFGFYAMAIAISTLPLDRLNELVNRVMPGILSSVQSDKSELERYVRRVSQALSLAAFPVAVGLALVAGDMVPVLLGAKWEAAVGPLQLLSLSAVVRTLVPMLNQVLITTGNSRQSVRATLAAVVVMPLAFFFAARFSIRNVAAVWLLVYPLVVIPTLFVPAIRAAGVRAGRYLAALRPAAEASACMTVVVVAARATLLQSLSAPARLALGVPLGAAMYAGYLLLVHRERILEYLTWFRALRSRTA